MKKKTTKKEQGHGFFLSLKSKKVFLFFGIFIFFVLVGGYVYKKAIAKPTFMYVKVRVGQGYWWASTQRPSLWFVNAIQKGRTEFDLTGKPLAQIERVYYYPWHENPQQNDVYVFAKLRVSKGGGSKYTYKREVLSVGAPIDFEFPGVQYSGTVVGMSDKPIQEVYVEKRVTLTKRGAYPWEYDAIPVNETLLNNGETDVVRFLSKEARDTVILDNDPYGNLTTQTEEARRYITVTLVIKGRIEKGQFLFGEEQVVMPGKSLIISTPKFIMSGYVVMKIE